MKRLEPHIYMIYGRYCRKQADIYSFMKKVAKADTKYKDDVENVLLSSVEINGDNQQLMNNASEFIENYENGIVPDYSLRYTSTDIGKSCIMNGITEFDVFKNERQMDEDISQYFKNTHIIDNPSDLIDCISRFFIRYLPDSEENLKRLLNKEARNFYAMLFDWRMNNKSYSEMIGLFVGYWRSCYRKNNQAVIYVGRWGDTTIKGSVQKHYVKLAEQTPVSIINLAIVRIKEEQDFIDNVLMKYVEVLHDMELLNNSFYARIKYGTDDESIICLIKNGLSLSSAVLLYKKYQQFLTIDVENSTVVFSDELISEMEKENENQIMIFEVQSCM